MSKFNSNSVIAYLRLTPSLGNLWFSLSWGNLPN